MLQTLKSDYQQFLKALETPQEVQLKLLMSIIHSNKDSVFGQEHQFHQIDSTESYQQLVPIHSYEDFSPHIKRMQEGENNVLFSEAAVTFETTGGSSGGNKVIPWNSAAFTALRHGINPWLADLLKNRPSLLSGSSYWSISPVGKANSPSHDIMFFGGGVSKWLESTLAVPLQMSAMEDMDAWAYWTLRYLIYAKELRFISVWSPTFILQLIRKLLESFSQVTDDITKGTVSFAIPDWLDPDHLILKANPARAEETLLAVQQKNFCRLWPELELISCWKDGSSSYFIEELTVFFPNVEIQGKGLLATEGIVTAPLLGLPFPVLTIASAFYEFIDRHNNIHLAHQLEEQELYRVVITTHAGLYRYDTGDIARMCGYAEKTPMLQFMGRDQCCDLCGEKLEEGFVQQCLDSLEAFSMLAPSNHAIPHYVLLLEKTDYSVSEANQAAHKIDQLLDQNSQYQYAKNIDQLAPIKAVRAENILSRYIAHAISQGQLLGDIKPPKLYYATDWESWVYDEGHSNE